jgi:hypothetical protein
MNDHLLISFCSFWELQPAESEVKERMLPTKVGIPFDPYQTLRGERGRGWGSAVKERSD